jgi:hypothetical protein
MKNPEEGTRGEHWSGQGTFRFQITLEADYLFHAWRPSGPRTEMITPRLGSRQIRGDSVGGVWRTGLIRFKSSHPWRLKRMKRIDDEIPGRRPGMTAPNFDLPSILPAFLPLKSADSLQKFVV